MPVVELDDLLEGVRGSLEVPLFDMRQTLLVELVDLLLRGPGNLRGIGHLGRGSWFGVTAREDEEQTRKQECRATPGAALLRRN